jgi:ABC-type branched-subunit amino acid transport system substrate-binding protein
MKLKQAKPDCVLNWVLPKHGAIVLGTAAKMGFKPQWMTTSTLSDIPIMYKISKGLFKDVIFVTFAELPDSKNPLMKKYKAAHDKFAPKDRWGIFFYAGFYFVEPMVEAFRRCGRDLTVDTFVKAMESIKDFKGIGPKISFGPGQRQGTRSVFLAKCLEGGKIEQISDWMSSDIDVKQVIEKLKK